MSAAHLNILVGVLALQLKFVSQEQLFAAVHDWTSNKTRRLDEIFIDHKAIDEETRKVLVALVEQHLKLSGGDSQKSLDSIGVSEDVAETLAPIVGSDVMATVTVVSRGPNDKTARQGDTQVPSSNSSSPQTPATVNDRFQIIRSHAKGGLGEVFVARDAELNREVALKEMLPRVLHDENSRSRFMMEAEVTGRLEHPGIVPVYGLGIREDGRPYYAMRFVQGQTLKDAIDDYHASNRPDTDGGKQSIELRSLLSRLADVCNAIEYAHSRGVLHRDLKPSNIMLGKYGETLVVDWGLAKALGKREEKSQFREATLLPGSDTGSAPTVVGQAMGTPAFMPPEQASGRIEKLGPRSDVYSLGATLYYLLTGVPPVGEGELSTILHQVKTGTIDRPRSRNHAVDRGLDAICMKAMATLPEERYESPRELADDLECWMADEPVSALEESTIDRSRRFLRRHRSWTVAFATALLLAALASLVALLFVVNARNDEAAQRLIADNKALEAEQNEARAIEAEEDARDEARKARREQVKTLLATTARYYESEQEERALVALMEAYKLSEGDPEIEAANRDRVLAALSAYPLVEAWENVRAATINDSGSRVATGSDAGEVFVWNASDGTLICGPLAHDDVVLGLHFDELGQSLAVSCLDGTVRIWNVDEQRISYESKSDTPIGQLWLARDGNSLTTLDAELQLLRHELSTSIVVPLGPARTGQLLDQSDDYLLVSRYSDQPSVVVISKETGELVGNPVEIDEESSVYSGSLSGNGERFALVITRTLNLERQQTIYQSVEGEAVPQIVTYEVITPVGFVSVYSSATGVQVGESRQFEVASVEVDLSPDGSELVVATEDWRADSPYGRGPTSGILCWNLETGKPLFDLVYYRFRSGKVHFDPTGQRVFIAGRTEEGLSSIIVVGRIQDNRESEEWTELDGELVPYVNAATWETPIWWNDYRLGDLVFDANGAFVLAVGDAGVNSGARLWNLGALDARTRPLPMSNGASPFFTREGYLLYGAPTNTDEAVMRRVKLSDSTQNVEVVRSFQWIESTYTAILAVPETRATNRELVGKTGAKLVRQEVSTVLRFVAEERVRSTPSFLDERDRLREPPQVEEESLVESLNALPIQPGPTHVIANSPDWSIVLLENAETGESRMWDTKTSQPVGVPMRFWSALNRAFFSDDSSILVTLTVDNSIQCWDTQTGIAISPPMTLTYAIDSLDLSPDGRYIAVTNQDGIRLIELFPDRADSVDELAERVRKATLHEMDSTGSVMPIVRSSLSSSFAVPGEFWDDVPPAPEVDPEDE